MNPSNPRAMVYVCNNKLHRVGISYNIFCWYILYFACMGTSKAPPVLYLSFISHTAPEASTFVPCNTFYAPTHTISYLWHGRECCTQNIALGTGSRAIVCIQHSLPCYNYYILYKLLLTPCPQHLVHKQPTNYAIHNI